MVTRARKAANERGAALFIVVLVITLLTAVGVFAAHAASLAQSASGYSRRAAAAFYLGEFATNVVASDMAGKESEYLQLTVTGANDCRATAGLATLLGSTTTIIPCRAVEFEEMKKLMPTAIRDDADGNVFGALSRPDHPVEQTIKGTFRVEVTDLGPAPTEEGMGMSGSAVSNVWQTAFTTIARLSPTSATGECKPDAIRASENQSIRGYVVFSTLGAPPPGAL